MVVADRKRGDSERLACGKGGERSDIPLSAGGKYGEPGSIRPKWPRCNAAVVLCGNNNPERACPETAVRQRRFRGPSGKWIEEGTFKRKYYENRKNSMDGRRFVRRSRGECTVETRSHRSSGVLENAGSGPEFDRFVGKGDSDRSGSCLLYTSPSPRDM